MKSCSKCHLDKPDSAFYSPTRRVCKECRKTQQRCWRMANQGTAKASILHWLAKPENRQKSKELTRSWYLRNRDRVKCSARRNHLRRTYNLSMDQFDVMLQEQHDLCALCFLPFTSEDRPYVDHDHACCSGNTSCGKCIRGLIHSKCNKVLGMANDSIELLEKAVSYLRSVGRVTRAA